MEFVDEEDDSQLDWSQDVGMVLVGTEHLGMSRRALRMATEAFGTNRDGRTQMVQNEVR